MKRATGLKWKLTAFVSLLLTGTLAAISVLVLRGINANQTEETERSLAHLADRSAFHVRQLYVMGDRIAPDAFLAMRGQELAVDLGTRVGLLVNLYDTKGRQVGNSAPSIAPHGQYVKAMQMALSGRRVYVQTADQVDYYTPLEGPDGLMGVLHLQQSIAEQAAFFRYMVRLFIWTGSVVLATGLVLGYFFVSREVAVIARLQAAAAAIRENRFIRQPVLNRRDELGDLGRGLYEMSRTIEAQIAAQKAFIGNISHEFKTPVTSIRAYADLLGMYGDDPFLREDASKHISQEADRLTAMIDNVLELSKLDRYEFNLNPEPVELKPVLDEVIDRMRAKAEKFGVSLETRMAAHVTLIADRASLVHILMNLLDNAIKYNKSGGCAIVSTGVDDHYGEIAIRDTGIGIPASFKERIFEPFFTVSSDRARGSSGTGLGLPLVKSLVERQGGTIRLAESDERGSVFIVKLPLWKNTR